MTTYLLDTNVCIALINGTQVEVRRRFQRAVARDGVALLSAIVAYELWFGVAKSQRKAGNTHRVQAFLAGPLEWIPFDDDDARAAGEVRAELEAAGTPIGAYRCPPGCSGATARRNARHVKRERVPACRWPEVGGLGSSSPPMTPR